MNAKTLGDNSLKLLFLSPHHYNFPLRCVKKFNMATANPGGDQGLVIHLEDSKELARLIQDM